MLLCIPRLVLFVMYVRSYILYCKLISFKLDLHADKVVQDVYILAMVFTLSLFVLKHMVEFRQEVKSLYITYFNHSTQKKGIKLLGKRTVVFRNVENLDMRGNALKKIVNMILAEKTDTGKMFDCIFLPDYTDSFKFERELKRLEFFNDIVNKNNINVFSRLFMPKKILNQNEFIKSIRELNKNLRVKDLYQVNSGYAFACFSSFEAISVIQKCSAHKGILQVMYSFFLPSIENRITLKMQPFIDEKDINWDNCFLKKNYKSLRLLWRILIFIVLIFISTPTVS